MQMLDNARRLHAFFRAPDRLENDKPVSGGEIARVDDVDVLILRRGKARILIAAGKLSCEMQMWMTKSYLRDSAENTRT